MQTYQQIWQEFVTENSVLKSPGRQFGAGSCFHGSAYGHRLGVPLMESLRRCKMITIKDMADMLGTSTTTVSNVIHGKTSEVSQKTVERVEKLLEEYD